MVSYDDGEDYYATVVEKNAHETEGLFKVAFDDGVHELYPCSDLEVRVCVHTNRITFRAVHVS